MAKSLTDVDGGLVTATISINGSVIPGEYSIISIDVKKEINKISTAYVRLQDGGFSSGDDFQASDSTKFDPGAEVEIKAGYASNEESIYKGIIVRHGIKIGNNGSELYLDCKDKAIKSTIGRKSVCYTKMSDSDIISKILNDHGITPDVITTSEKHPEYVQYNVTDWDFIQLLAENNGLLIRNDEGKVEVTNKLLSGSAKLEVINGTQVYSFKAEMDARSQIGAVHSIAWDPKKQEVVSDDSKISDDVKQGDLKTKKLAEVIGLDNYNVVSSTNLSPDVLKSIGTGILNRSNLSKIRGEVIVIGNTLVTQGDIVTFSNFSKHFNGDAFISSVSHSIEDGNWKTTYSIGLNFERYSEKVSNVYSPLTSGVATAYSGLTIGKVKQIDSDPDGQMRINVILPILEDSNQGVWARLGSFYSGDSCGAFFIPEIDNEVIVGFLNNDPSFPVILGNLYSSKIKAAYEPTSDNFIKAFVSREKIEIIFDDEKKILTLQTPGGHKIVLDDDQQSINAEDSNGNSILMSKDGITIDSIKDVIIKAAANVQVESTSNTEIKATGDFTGEGMNVAFKGTTKFGAEGAQAELKGSAQTVVKGGVVMIN